MYLSIGLMSGTSMDGIDAALLETDGDAQIVDHGYYAKAYDPAFKCLLQAAQYIIHACRGNLTEAHQRFDMDGLNDYLSSHLGLNESDAAKKLIQCYHYMDMPTISLANIIEHSTRLHAQAVTSLLQTCKLAATDITVIGYHGQTMYHQPREGISVIVGDGQYLAKLTGIAVVNDFRAHDVRLGGLGAPFAPIYHQALAKRDNHIPAAVVNCGGIANITLIANTKPEDLIGFDTGPGNGLLDKLVQQRTQCEEQMDKDGKYGLQGTVDNTVLAALYRHAVTYHDGDFFEATPPKSLDIGDLQLIPELMPLTLPDACATLAAFTADTIVQSLNHVKLTAIPTTWILAGGGWFNPMIKQQLSQRLHQKMNGAVKIVTADEIGWHSQALEAQIFAYFAIRALQGKPLSVPGTTRVSRPVSGGQLHLSGDSTHPHIDSFVALNPAVHLGYS